MNATWLKYLPRFIRAKLDGRLGLQAIMSNTGWLVADKVLRMVVGLSAGVWVARYLGPEQFGLFNYALAFVAIFSGVASLGLNGVVVRDLVRQFENTNATLGTAFLLQFLGGLLSLAFAVIAINIIRPDDLLVRNMVVVLGVVMVFKSTEVIKYWFESKVQSRYTVWVENSAFLLFVAVKISLILADAPLMGFAWTYCAEGMLVAIGLTLVYISRGGQLSAWRLYYPCARSLLKDSWPLLLSGTLVLVNMSIDKIMLGQLSNERDVGLYSVANAFVSFWYFIPVAIIGSVAPKLIKTHTADLVGYDNLAKKIYKYFGGGAVIVAVIISLFANHLVAFLYGANFKEAGAILAVSIWAIVFVFQVSFRGRLLVIEGEQVYITLLIFLGTLSNIVLNVLLIPSNGAIGAAIAYTLSWGMSAVIFPVIFKKTRHHAMWSLGLNWEVNSCLRGK